MDRVSTPDTPSATSAAAILLVITSSGLLMPRRSAFRITVTGIELSFVSVGVWWLVFSIPLFSARAGAAADARSRRNAPGEFDPCRVRPSMGDVPQLRVTARRSLCSSPSCCTTTASRPSSDGGDLRRRDGIDQNFQIEAFVVVQFVGIPFRFCSALAAGSARRWESFWPRVYNSDQHPCLFHAAVGSSSCWVSGRHRAGRQPGVEPMLFARIIPRHKVIRVLRLLSVSKNCRYCRPALFAISSASSGRAARPPVGHPFFICGGLVLTRVNVAEAKRTRGKRRSREGRHCAAAALSRSSLAASLRADHHDVSW